MSMLNRLDWSRKIAALTERFKQFEADPGQEQFDAAVTEMRAYAEAAQAGGIEIPERFIAS